MVKIVSEFTSLDLSKKEIEILSYLYESGGPKQAKRISKEINISEQKIYPYLKNLVIKRFIIAEGKYPTRYCLGSATTFISELNKQKDRIVKIEDLFKQLAERQKRLEKKENPFYEIATTRKEGLKLQLKAFQLAEKEFLQVLNIYHNPKSNRTHKLKYENAVLDMLKRGVNFKKIFPNNKNLPKLLRGNPRNLEVRRLNTTFQRCDIIDERFVLLKILDENDPLNFIACIFIDDKALAKNLKQTFLVLWEEAITE